MKKYLILLLSLVSAGFVFAQQVEPVKEQQQQETISSQTEPLLVEPGKTTPADEKIESNWPEDKQPLPDETTVAVPPEETADMVDPSKVPVLEPEERPETSPYWSMTVNSPIFGKVSFLATDKRVVDGKAVLYVNIPDPAKVFKLGPLTIRNGELQLADGKISYTGDADLWGQKAKVGIKKIQFEKGDVNAAALDSQKPGPQALGFQTAERLQKYKMTDIKKIDFGLTAEKDAFKLRLFPGKTIQFKTADLIVSREKEGKGGVKAELRIGAHLFGQKVRLSGKLSVPSAMAPELEGTPLSLLTQKVLKQIAESFVLTASIKRFPLVAIVPVLSKTPLKDFYLTGAIEVSKENGLVITGQLEGAEEGKPAELALIPGKTISLNEYKISFSPDKKVTISSTATFLGQKVNTSGSVDLSAKVATLSGNFERAIGELIPQLANQDIGKLVMSGEFSFSTAKEFYLKGKIKGSDTEEGVKLYGLKLQKAYALLNVQAKRVKVYGEIDLFGLLLSGGFNAIWGGDEPSVTFSAKIKQGVKEWAPFKLIPNIPQPLQALKNIVVSDVQAGASLQFGSVISDTGADVFDDSAPKKAAPKKAKTAKIESEEIGADEDVSADKDLPQTVRKKKVEFKIFVHGKTTILNTLGHGIFQITFGQNTPFALIIGFELPKGWKLSQSFPELFTQKTFVTEALDLFRLGKTRFIVSTYETTIGKINLKQGINFRTGIVFDGTETNVVLKSLSTVLTKTGDKGAQLYLSGAINPFELRNLEFKVGLSTGGFEIKLPPVGTVFTAGKLSIAVRGEPSIALQGSFTIIPVPGAQPLNFMGGIVFSTVDVGLEGSMTGLWTVIPGFSFGNLGLKGTQRYTVIADALSSFGVSALIPSKFGVTGETEIGGGEKPLRLMLFMQLGSDVSNIALVGTVENPETFILLFDPLAKHLGVHLDHLVDVLPLRLTRASVKFVPSETRIGDIEQKMGVGGDFVAKVLGKNLSASFMLSKTGLIARGDIDSFNLGPITVTGTGGVRKNPKVDITVSLAELPRFIINGKLLWPGLIDTLTDIEVSKDRLAFTTKTCLGPKGTQICARIEGTTISFADPLALMSTLRPEDLNLTIEYEDTLSLVLKRDVAIALDAMKAQIENDMNNLIIQVGRATALADIDRQSRKKMIACLVKNPAERLWNNQANVASPCGRESANLLALQSKYSLERTKLGQGVRELLDKTGASRWAANMLQGFKIIGVAAFESGSAVIKNVANLVTIEQIYWKGSLKDVQQGVIPSIRVKLRIAGGESEERLLGAFDMRDPIKSAAKIAENVANLGRDALLRPLVRRRAS